jgi:hypothetical protein
MLLALASALVAQSVPPQPEARAIEAAQAEIEALWRPGTAIIVQIAAPGARYGLRRQILTVRHPRHCISEIGVRFLEAPLGAVQGSPQKFDWSELASIGQATGNRVSYTLRLPPFPIVDGRPQPY